MALFLAHTLILAGLSYGAARQLVRPLLERVLAAAFLGFGNIVATCLLLASCNHLGHSAWFFRTSLLLGGATWLLLRKIRPEPAPVSVADDRPNPWLLALFVLTLAPIAYAGVRLAATYEPNNYDSLAYHLPRAMFYLGQENLAHFYTGNDRQVYFPLNYNLLQLSCLIYSPPLQAVNFINLGAWVLAGLAIYRLARQAAFSANAALIAAWLALTSTQVLAQATATNNDLPLATGLLVTLVFLLRWREARRTRDALLAALAAGLTAGSKLTVIFFGPAAGIIVLVLAWQHWRQRAVRPFFTGVRAWLVPALLAVAFAAPFAAINFAEKGQWITHTYDFTLNRPFSWASTAQTSEAYLVQLFLEPLHRFTFDLEVTAQLNAWGVRTFFPHWNEAYAFSPLYLFPPDLNEDHVWFGFSGPFILLCAGYCLVRWRRLSAPAVWFAWLGIGWLVTYFLLNKWSLYNQRYFVPAILVMSPCVAAMVDAGWNSPRLRGATRNLLILLAAAALWLAGIYLFQNTSRPYAPLWAGQPPPPALPALPPLAVQRLASQPRINIDSTDGNERIFLFMTLGRHQRFTARSLPQDDAYNVFSEWGFPRKVAYSNIEQRSSYTLVAVPTKRTAGVEFLGTIGRGQPALDYYGLAPHPGQLPSADGNRNILVALNYGPREPDRYRYMGIKVAGLNAPDRAQLRVEVEYTDGTIETIATFAASGEAPAPVTRPFRRFLVKVEDQDTGAEIGAIDIPYLFRDRPPEDEAGYNPASLFFAELVDTQPTGKVVTEGLGAAEGPYAQWELPLVRWARSPVVRLELPPANGLDQLELSFSVRPQARETAVIDVRLNGAVVQTYRLTGRTMWSDQKLQLKPGPGKNIVEIRNISAEPDWLDYVERYPDVKNHVLGQKVPLEQGGREHWEMFGRHETRTLDVKHEVQTVPDSLYFVFRSLRVEGFAK